MSLSRRAPPVAVSLLLTLLSGGGLAPAAAQSNQGAQAVPTAPVVDTGKIEVKPSDGSLLRIPFDQPFTLIVPVTGTEDGQQDPELFYQVFGRKLDAIPQDVCQKGAQAKFAGRFTSGSPPETKAHFLFPAQEPNDYLVFCFRMKAPLSATLSAAEKDKLVNDIAGELQDFPTEIESAAAAKLSARLRAAIDRALANYSQRKGLAGTISLDPSFAPDGMLPAFRNIRQALANCDQETIVDLLDPIETALADNAAAKSQLEMLEQSFSAEALAAPGARLSTDRCRELYGRAAAIVQGSSFSSPGDQAVALDNLQGATPPPEDELLKKVIAENTIPAMQNQDILLLASTLDGSSAARNYASADTGFAFVPELESGTPYMGVNLYLRPVNPPSVTPLSSGTFRQSFLRRFSFMLGVTAGSDLEQSETIGGETVNLVENWTSAGSLLGGVGLRITPAVRVGGGAIVYRQLDSLIDRQASTEVSYYFSISLDVDVRGLFTGNGSGIFNGGTPNPNPPN